jgi:hypothetical protein
MPTGQSLRQFAQLAVIGMVVGGGDRGHPRNGATPVALRPCRGGVGLILLAIFRNDARKARFPSAVMAPYASEQTPARRENILSSTRR